MGSVGVALAASLGAKFEYLQDVYLDLIDPKMEGAGIIWLNTREGRCKVEYCGCAGGFIRCELEVSLNVYVIPWRKVHYCIACRPSSLHPQRPAIPCATSIYG